MAASFPSYRTMGTVTIQGSVADLGGGGAIVADSGDGKGVMPSSILSKISQKQDDCHASKFCQK